MVSRISLRQGLTRPIKADLDVKIEQQYSVDKWLYTNDGRGFDESSFQFLRGLDFTDNEALFRTTLKLYLISTCILLNKPTWI